VKALVYGFDGPVLIDEAYVDYGKYNLNSLCSRSENNDPAPHL